MTVQVKAAHVKLMVYIVFVTLIISIATATIVNRNTHNVDDVSKSVSHLEESVANLEESVDHMEEVAAAIEEQTPEEAERTAAIGRAVMLVPHILNLLCGEFPEHAACQQTSPQGGG
jgi:outer membrane murein-binding lipoprotein Lpp